MSRGYWLVQIDVSDPGAYEAYRNAVVAYLAAVGGKFLVRGGKREVKEGSTRSRCVVVEFQDYPTALACYESEAYARIRALREHIAVADFAVVEGV
jgi:uncharacterized protein (DUF1330 family)